MKFSVIVPTYMEESFISGCLESIRSQQYSRDQFEIIVSDASSSDGTVSVAKKIADQVLVTEKRGIAHGRNLGARNATGEILLFVDADVQLEPGFLRQCEAILERDGVVAVTGIARPYGGTFFQRLVYDATYWLVRLLQFFGLPLYPGLCVAYKKKAFDQVGGFREDFGVVEDLDLSRRISLLGRCEINTKAIARVSTRRLQKHGLSTVAFHVYNDLKYLLTGKAARYYPKAEETKSWLDIWRASN